MSIIREVGCYVKEKLSRAKNNKRAFKVSPHGVPDAGAPCGTSND